LQIPEKKNESNLNLMYTSFGSQCRTNCLQDEGVLRALK